MLNIKVNGTKAEYELNLPTSMNEITDEYIDEVTRHINVAPNYTLIGTIFKEKPSTLILAARQRKNKSDIAVIPIFIKAGATDDKMISSIKLHNKLIIAPSDIMLGHHVASPNNDITINKFMDLIDGDKDIYTKLLNSPYCYFIEFKIVPNCNIHGYYGPTDVAGFVSPFVTKIADK